jgi:hypothetical protein
MNAVPKPHSLQIYVSQSVQRCFLSSLCQFSHAISCWIDHRDVLVGGFLAPVAFCVTTNLIIFAIIVSAMRRMSAKATTGLATRGWWREVRAAAAVAVLLGLSWVFGGLVDTGNPDASLVLQYLFALCTTLQGFAIFLFFCVFNDKVRECVKEQFESTLVSRSSHRRPGHKMNTAKQLTMQLQTMSGLSSSASVGSRVTTVGVGKSAAKETSFGALEGEGFYAPVLPEGLMTDDMNTVDMYLEETPLPPNQYDGLSKGEWKSGARNELQYDIGQSQYSCEQEVFPSSKVRSGEGQGQQEYPGAELRYDNAKLPLFDDAQALGLGPLGGLGGDGVDQWLLDTLSGLPSASNILSSQKE